MAAANAYCYLSQDKREYPMIQIHGIRTEQFQYGKDLTVMIPQIRFDSLSNSEAKLNISILQYEPGL